MLLKISYLKTNLILCVLFHGTHDRLYSLCSLALLTVLLSAVKSFQHWGRRTGGLRSSEHSSQYPWSGGCFSGVPLWTTAGGHSLMLVSTSLIALAVTGLPRYYPLVLNLFQLGLYLTETLSQNQPFFSFYEFLVLKEMRKSHSFSSSTIMSFFLHTLLGDWGHE